MIEEIGGFAVKALEEFWLEAVRAVGWQREDAFVHEVTTGDAEGGPPSIGTYQMVGYTSEELGLHYVDMWWGGSADSFHGITMIQDPNGRTLWRMQYQGWIREEATPLVKAAIGASIEAGKFRGGRGPDRFNEEFGPDLSYRNVDRQNSQLRVALDVSDGRAELDFIEFQGEEWAVKRNPDHYTLGDMISFVTYSGGILFAGLPETFEDAFEDDR